MTAQPPRKPPQPRLPTTIALLTCRHHDHIDHASEGRLMQELVRQGAMASLIAWDDLTTNFDLPTDSEHTAYVIRTTWDYWNRLDDFRAFLEEMDRIVAPLLNSPSTALANLDKTYLKELQAANVPIVPTIFVAKGRSGANAAAAIDQAKANNWAPLIIKPTIAAAAAGLKKFDRPDAAALGYLNELTRNGAALLQKYLPRITTEGETSLVYFDNTFSHAVTKVPAPGDFRSQGDFGGVYTLVQPTEAQLHAADLALAAWQDRYGDKPLYARVDLVPSDHGQPLLGELELIEPELFLDMHEHAAERFATAIMARVAQRENPRRGSTLWTLAGFTVLLACLGVFALGMGVLLKWAFGWISNWLFGGP